MDNEDSPKVPKDKAQIYPQPFPNVYCETFTCTRPAVYIIGRPDAPLSLGHRLCRECLENVVRSIPEDMLGCVPAKAIEHLSAGVILDGVKAIRESGLMSDEEIMGYLGPDFGAEEFKGEEVSEPASSEPSPKPASLPEHTCNRCDKPFGSRNALLGHLRHCNKEG